jgi:hypothetical protein
VNFTNCGVGRCKTYISTTPFSLCPDFLGMRFSYNRWLESTHEWVFILNLARRGVRLGPLLYHKGEYKYMQPKFMIFPGGGGGGGVQIRLRIRLIENLFVLKVTWKICGSYLFFWPPPLSAFVLGWSSSFVPYTKFKCPPVHSLQHNQAPTFPTTKSTVYSSVALGVLRN